MNLLKEDYTDYHLLFGSQAEDDKLLNLWTQNNTFWLLFVSYTTKTWLFYLFKDYEQGLKTALLSEKYSESCTAYIISGANIFYTTLTMLAVCNHNVDMEQNKILLQKVSSNQEKNSIFSCSLPRKF